MSGNANFITLLEFIYFSGNPTPVGLHFYVNGLLARVLLIVGTNAVYLSTILSVVYRRGILDFHC